MTAPNDTSESIIVKRCLGKLQADAKPEGGYIQGCLFGILSKYEYNMHDTKNTHISAIDNLWHGATCRPLPVRIGKD